MDVDTKLIELEAKLIAHRQLIITLLQQFAHTQKDPDKFWAALDFSVIVQDHQEDPGVEPHPAYALNSRTAFELCRLVDAAKAAG